MRFIFFEEAGRVRNSLELANAFERDEWIRIVHYFLRSSGTRGGPTAQYGGFGENGPRARRNIDAMQRTIGRDMGDMTASSYMRKASRYGISFPFPGVPTFEQIYDFLERRRGYELPPFLDADIPGGQWQSDNTQEQGPSEIGTWVQTNATSWDSEESLRQDYLRPWLTELRNKRDQSWWDWLEGEASGNRSNMWNRELYATRDRLFQIIDNEGSVTKEQVDRALWNWLSQTDTVYQNWSENQ